VVHDDARAEGRSKSASATRWRSRTATTSRGSFRKPRLPAARWWFQVPDVDATFTEWSARGVEFGHGPRKAYWGYGTELRDPDGYLVRLWDVRSMKDK
jgi:hypothetical protein